MQTLTGIGVAVPTLLDGAGQVDTTAHRTLARRLAANGASMVLVAGTTGGGAHRTRDQRIDLVTSSSDAEVTVVVGLGEHAEAGELAVLSEAGAGAALVAFDPALGLKAVLSMRDRTAAEGLTLVAYHHPAHHPALPNSWYREFAREEIPVKNSDPSEAVLEEMLAAGLHVLVGSSQRLADAHRASGVLSGIASICLSDVAAAYRGDVTAHQQILTLEASLTDRVAAIEQAVRTDLGR